ncbi:MAG: carbohydrate porin [Caulobacteraceae bacterium]|nr:carbohydrate porin [Caulobacteraceae bacterium]
MSRFVGSIPALAAAAGFAWAPAAQAQANPEAGAVAWIASYTGEAAANVSGGLRQGQDYAGQLVLGADVDLGRAAGLAGATLHVAAVDRHGRNLAQDSIGGGTSVQEVYGAENARLGRLTIEQSLFDGRVVVEGGRTVANLSFLSSPLCANFQINSACGTPIFAPRTSGFTMWPVSSWGGHVQGWLTPKVDVHAGAYEVNPSHGGNSDHGLDWSTSGATGVVAPFTLGYTTGSANGALPRTYEVGGWYDNSDYADPLRDAAGGLAAVSGKPYAVRDGRSGAFARFEQTVTRPDPASQRGLTLFGVAMTRTSGQPIEDRFLELGLVQRGTFAGRDGDTVGFVVNRQTFSAAALENLRLIRGGAGGSPPADETMMELSYGVQATRDIRVQPNLAYIVNPDPFTQPGQLRNAPNALVVGLRLDVNLADLTTHARTN